MRILIHRLGSLGDTVVALPCFKLIRLRYPDSHISVLTNSPVSNKAAPLESILENMALINGAFYYPMGSRDYPALRRLHAELRSQSFDLLISLSIGRHLPTCVRDYLFFKTCNIPRIIGLPWARRDRVCLPLKEGPNYEPEARRLLRRIRGIGNSVQEIDPNEARWTDLKLTDGEITQSKNLLQESGIENSFLVASVGTKWSGNDWGMENWSLLIQKLGHALPELSLVMLGSSDESERCDALLSSWRGPRANLCGKASPRASAAIMRSSRAFIGHDSGPMHLAAASGTKCVAIFSGRNPPGQWFPLGKSHHVFYPYSFYRRELWNDLAYQKNAIGSIQVEEVLAAAKKCLS